MSYKDRMILKACKCYCDNICERGMAGMCFHKHGVNGNVKNDFQYNECNDLKLFIREMSEN